MSKVFICKLFHGNDTPLFYNVDKRRFQTERTHGFDTVLEANAVRNSHVLTPYETELYSILIMSDVQLKYLTKEVS